MSSALDQPGPVREPIDPDRLAKWLVRALPGFPGGPVEVAQFASGYSNLTYLIRAEGWQGVLRRPPIGSQVATAHDMVREAKVLAALATSTPLVPRLLAVCEDREVLGAPFFVMERVEGIILRRDPPADLGLGPARAAAIGAAFVDTLAALHQLPVGDLGLGRPEGYARRQLEGWVGRWQKASDGSQPGADGIAEVLSQQLDAFPDTAAALVHNDFKLDNLVLDPAAPERVRAVLDWEMATVGDPLLDLGTSLGYWTEAGDDPVLLAFRSGPTHLPGMPTRAEIARAWATATGRPLDQLVLATAFGLFKIVVIAQQIYVRYAKGLTTDPRFGALPQVIAALARRAEQTLDTNSV